MARYTFGHSQTAADRLRLIADFFNTYSASFVSSGIEKNAETAIDLGCATGHTTDMLRKAANSRINCGLDNAKDFLLQARINYPECRFEEHDVTCGGFPFKSDILFSRFLLTHLKEVENVLNIWVNELNPGGLLFIDELEDIVTDIPVFRKYLELNTGLVASQGGQMFIGKFLGKNYGSLNVVFSDSLTIPVENETAAGWFYPNTVSIWNKEKYILKNTIEKERMKIKEELLNLQNGKKIQGNITWKMKHIIIKKTA
jgi:SAM-dependent methyltransferase